MGYAVEIKEEDIPIMIGTLNRKVAIRGFEIADIGHPVFELKDRYIVYLDSSTPAQISGHGIATYYQNFKIAVPYYKNTLAPYIDFITPATLKHWRCAGNRITND